MNLHYQKRRFINVSDLIYVHVFKSFWNKLRVKIYSKTYYQDNHKKMKKHVNIFRNHELYVASSLINMVKPFKSWSTIYSWAMPSFSLRIDRETHYDFKRANRNYYYNPKEVEVILISLLSSDRNYYIRSSSSSGLFIFVVYSEFVCHQKNTIQI